MNKHRIELMLEETTRKHQELADFIQGLGNQVGDLGNKFGSFTAGLLAPSVKRVLEEEFGAEIVQQHLWVTRKDKNQEFDLLGISSHRRNEVVLAEIKSKLTASELKKFEKKFTDFFYFMPELKGKTLKGLLAAVDMPKGMAERVASRGFYLMQSDSKAFELLPNPKGFRARTSQG